MVARGEAIAQPRVKLAKRSAQARDVDCHPTTIAARQKGAAVGFSVLAQSVVGAHFASRSIPGVTLPLHPGLKSVVPLGHGERLHYFLKCYRAVERAGGRTGVRRKGQEKETVLLS